MIPVRNVSQKTIAEKIKQIRLQITRFLREIDTYNIEDNAEFYNQAIVFSNALDFLKVQKEKQNKIF